MKLLSKGDLADRGDTLRTHPFKGERKPLQSGMVFALEPKFVFPKLGAVGIELDYIVRESGLERVTQFPKDVITL